jgi:EthD domain
MAISSSCPNYKSTGDPVFKQICFFKKRTDMTMEQFMDYYENHHSKLGQKIGKSSIPNALRYVRRYLTPAKNPVTGEVHDCGYDCIMEIWWNSRADFENSQAIVSDPKRLPFTKEDETHLFLTHANPIAIAEEYDSPTGPNGETFDWVPVIRGEATKGTN